MLPLLPTASRFPVPDWKTLGAHPELESRPSAELNAYWTERGREWVNLLRAAFGTNYIGYESTNFWLLSSQSAETCRQLIQWAEQTRSKVVTALALTPSDHLFGKCPILLLHDLDTYYEYLGAYLPDGDHALTGGMYINDGYGHFVFTFLDMNQAESTLAHELAHALVSHLPLPAWLNEGIAQLAEIAVTGRDNLQYDELRETLDTYWSRETIQDLWTGRGFNRQDGGQLQSYHLAKVLTRKLTGNMTTFRAFVQEADAFDAAEGALAKHYGLSLQELTADYLGDGDWSPVPNSAPDAKQASPLDGAHLIRASVIGAKSSVECV